MTNKSENSKNIDIVGFSDIKIDSPNTFLGQFGKENKASIQFFDARHIAGEQHLYFAAVNALNAFKTKMNISNSLAIELLLYASGQRQIKKAVNMLGIKQDTSNVAVIIITENKNKKDNKLRLVAEKINGKRNDNVLELTDKKINSIKKMFKISNREFESKLKKEGLEKEALTDLIIERMALLITRK